VVEYYVKAVEENLRSAFSMNSRDWDKRLREENKN
jgi:hypothetical protein